MQNVQTKLRPKENSANKCEKGFSLIEVTVALVVFLIVVLGVFSALIYALNYNKANNIRSLSLAVLHQEKENLRSAKFTSSLIDADLVGGIKTLKTVVAKDGNKFEVKIIIDDDPYIAGIQIDNNQTLKEIELTVSALNPTPGWQTAVPASILMRRVRAN